MEEDQVGGKSKKQELSYDLISGPVSIYQLKKGNKTATFFGDIHFSDANMCIPCRKEDEEDGRCITIVRLLKKLFSESEKQIDFFVESAFLSKDQNVGHVFENQFAYTKVIGSIIDEFGECLVPNKPESCKNKYPHARLHYIDLRFGDGYTTPFTTCYTVVDALNNDLDKMKTVAVNYKYDKDVPFIYADPAYLTFERKNKKTLANKNYRLFLRKILSSKKTYTEFVKLFYTSTDLHSDIEAFLGTGLANAIFNKKDQAEYKERLDGGGRHKKGYVEPIKIFKTHKIKKQIDAIADPEHREYLFAFIDTTFHEFFNNFDFNKLKNADEYLDLDLQRKKVAFMNSKELLAYFTEAKSVIDNLAYLLLDTGVNLVDAYALARMVKFYDKTDHIIAYAGDLHCENYKTFFAEFMGMKKEQDISSSVYYKYALDDGSEHDNRCIISPKGKPFTFTLV